ncbi:hypothetical protein [Halobellus ruber]|uniref:Uncharacterized protein n=1 Tax=Halobellus ruber TaxID=2761102 RepID=A0A7J9SF32_9EURY|nr:hypothetical protein [Halobellus ruber]MBB6645112.1 hypothetical protein [Halobellus ruber]
MTREDNPGNRWARLTFEIELFRYSPREWLLMSGNRVFVAVLEFLLLVGVLAGLVGSGLVPLREETPVLFLLFALVAANFTLIAIVTSLSQFVLSRRLETPGEIRRKIDDTIDYREELGRSIGESVIPVQPDAFLLMLFQHASTQIDILGERGLEGRTRFAREELNRLVTELGEHCDYVISVLNRPSSGVKHALFVSLSADYETAVYQAWHLQWEHADEFTEEAAEPLARLAGTLQHIEVASRLFKTVFIESEVSELSRYLLYVGLPAQLAAVTLTLVYTAGSGLPLPAPTLRVVVPAVIAAGFAPFLLLSSYVVRLTVVAHRTADTFPFSSYLSDAITATEEHDRE